MSPNCNREQVGPSACSAHVSSARSRGLSRAGLLSSPGSGMLSCSAGGAGVSAFSSCACRHLRRGNAASIRAYSKPCCSKALCLPPSLSAPHSEDREDGKEPRAAGPLLGQTILSASEEAAWFDTGTDQYDLFGRPRPALFLTSVCLRTYNAPTHAVRRGR